VLNAEPFHRGLRFRHNRGAECAASECSLMCKDLSYNGYVKKVIDPQVRLAYNARDFAAVRRRGPGMRMDIAVVDPAFAAEEERASAHVKVVPRGFNMAAADGASAASSNPDGPSQQRARLAIDGDSATAWVGDIKDVQWWLEVDLGRVQEMRSMMLVWTIGCAAGYTFSASTDRKVRVSARGPSTHPCGVRCRWWVVSLNSLVVRQSRC
jgi:hypothetical protein